MSCDNLKFQQAKLAELNQWITHMVYTEVKDKGQRCISTRWVCTEKETAGEKVYKARLVVSGFEDDLCGARKDSPTCCKGNLRVVIDVAVSHK